MCKQVSFLEFFIIVLLERLHDLKKRKKFTPRSYQCNFNDKIGNLMVFGTVLAISRAYVWKLRKTDTKWLLERRERYVDHLSIIHDLTWPPPHATGHLQFAHPHNKPCLPPQNFAWELSSISLGTTVIPRRNEKQKPLSKARLSAKPLTWKWFVILMQIKLIFTTKVSHQTGFAVSLVLKARVNGLILLLQQLRWPRGADSPVSPSSYSFSKTGQWNLRRR